MALFRKHDASATGDAADAGGVLQPGVADDARRLALEIAGQLPMQRLDPIALGVVLEASEVAARAVQVSARSLDDGRWSDEEPCRAVVTDQRLLLRRASGELVSFWWSTVVGLEVDLAQQRMVLDFGDGHPCGLSGPRVAVPAVMAIARVYGAEGLIRHPSLESLRAPVVTPGS